MRQERVTRYQASILKELGFNEHVTAFYCKYFSSKDTVLKTVLCTYEQPQNFNKWSYSKTDISAPTVDEAIDWLRKKYHVVIYNAVPPFVDPTATKNPYILYRYAVKYCNLRDGWNGRKLIGSSNLTKNIYAAKRQGITLALRWIKKNPKCF